MNMMDRASMVPPPAPQSPGLCRLRIASCILLLLSALSVALIDVIRSISIYAVVPVAVLLIVTIALTILYWVKRSRLEKAYWTDERYSAHVSAAADRLRTAERRRAVQGRRW